LKSRLRDGLRGALHPSYGLAAAFDLTVGDLLATGGSDPFHVTAHDGRRG